MSQQLKQFVSQVLRITPQYIDIFGNGVPGMAGRPAATASAANAGGDTTQQLHKAVIEFARAYQDQDSTWDSGHEPGSDSGKSDLQTRADEIEGLLMVSMTLGVLSEKDAGRLIEKLHELLEG